MKTRIVPFHSRKGFVALGASLVLLAGAMAAQPAGAQTFSIDFQGPTIGVPDSLGGAPITPSDLLSAPMGAGPVVPGIPSPGPLPPPASHTGGLFGPLEADALSYGVDANILDQAPIFTGYFSVDEFAIGAPGTAVAAEAAVGEAAADVFISALVGGNAPFLDGDGLFPSGAPGLGLIEPNPPGPGFPDNGDNLDGVDVDTAPATLAAGLAGGGLYFSLDSAFPDPLEPAANLGTAAASGFVGGDVLSLGPAGAVTVYAPAVALGLDAAGPDHDDLDALILAEDGDGIYTPGVDALLFSVRRGSAIIGTIDVVSGMPIEEGDILTDPAAFGLPLGAPPVIVLPAEALGLATLRSGTAGPTGFGDDLNAMDVTAVPEPSTALLMLSALALIGMGRRRNV